MKGSLPLNLWQYRLDSPLHSTSSSFHFLAGDHLVVLIGGIAHFFTAQKYNQRSGRKRTNEQNAWVNSKCKKRSYVTLCIPCRLTLACISCENSTKLEECCLILTGLPSLLLGPISSDWSLCCPVSTPSVTLRRPSPTAFSQFLCPTLCLAFSSHFRSRRNLESKTLCLVSRQNRQRNRLLGGPPT